MNLKFVCAEGFEIADEICVKVQEYLPNLIPHIEVIRTGAFKGIFETQEILPLIEDVVSPDWDKDIVLIVIHGSLYFADLELFDPVALTLEYLPSKVQNTYLSTTEVPKIGAQFLPNNMSAEPRREPEYWAKIGVEEILHYFRIPEQHDDNCFFHAKKFGEATIADCWKDFCPKCLAFMGQLKDPLEFDKLYNKVQRIYRFA